jgi:hypothetical protein
MKVKTNNMMVRVLVSALALSFALPALAQDGGRGYGRERSEENQEEREQKQREREERRAAREAERGNEQGNQDQANQYAEQQAAQQAAQAQQQAEMAAQQAAAQQEAARVQMEQARQQERQAYDQEAQRAAAYEAARQGQVRQDRVIDRRGANEGQQQAIEFRNQQIRADEARRVEEARQARGYGETRDGNRDWNDGRRDGDRDRNDRDGRYAGGGDRDGRGDRDGNWNRDGRGDNRWNQDAQRRYDGYQRSADQYRRQALQRNYDSRYATLQNQQRNRQYRYQQDYWQRQRTWHSGWNNRRFDRNFVFAPVVFRYSRGGRWYDVNQYAVDTLQEAIRLGYEEGARAGDADRYDGWRGGYRDNFVYQDADFGFDGYYVALPEYQYYFREGFRRGYEDAYGRRYRYGRASNGRYMIGGNTLELILNLQRY